MTNPSQQMRMEESVSKEITQVVIKTFEMMFGVAPKAASTQIHSQCSVRADISGIIPLEELKVREMNGTLVLSFPEDTIYSLLGDYYQKPFGDLNGSVKSSVGELTNVLYSTMKKNLNQMGTSLRSAIPLVIVGTHQHELHCSFNCSTIVIDFATPQGSFSVYANIHREAAGKKAA